MKWTQEKYRNPTYEEYQALKAENERLKAEYISPSQQSEMVYKHDRELAKYKEALEFYADNKSYKYIIYHDTVYLEENNIFSDLGSKARQALNQEGGE